jgi:hypothetical protein
MMKSKRMRWAEHVTRMRAKRIAYKILVAKSEGNTPLGRYGWEYNIKMVYKEIGWGVME